MKVTNGQSLALEQLRAIEENSSRALDILSIQKRDGKFSLIVEVSIDCKGYEKTSNGLNLRNRERFLFLVAEDFPFSVPCVETKHRRFADMEHVQWGRHLCLYQSSITEWNPSDGMYGFIERLDSWLTHAAKGELDPIGAPLHPPVAYVSSRSGCTIIPSKNAPKIEDGNWFGFAELETKDEKRFNISGWCPVGQTSSKKLAPTILLSKKMPFEFPLMLRDLLTNFESRGVSTKSLFLLLKLGSILNPENEPLFVIIGSPMRGIKGSKDLKQHLVAWRIDPVVVKSLRLAILAEDPHPKMQEIRQEVEKIIWEWAIKARVEWCQVLENRQEIVRRRDQGSLGSQAFGGREISIWGCGALGSSIATLLTRAGVGKLILRDSGVVTPGLLIRQIYDESHIGRLKVQALSEQLKRINPDLPIEIHSSDILSGPLGVGNWEGEGNLIIDTTASSKIIKKLELKREKNNGFSNSIASMMIGHRADKGILVLSGANFSSGPEGVYRQAKLGACNRRGLYEFADEFWPSSPRQGIFQPEPGCSESTFVGSAADVMSLSATMLNQLAHDIYDFDPSRASFHFFMQCHSTPAAMIDQVHFYFEAEQVFEDPHSGYKIHLSNAAWKDIWACIESSKRLRGQEVETGGILFGERDDATRTFWVSEVEGPPPDSTQSQHGFVCGIQGVSLANEEKKARSRGAVQFIGMWHTHPDSLPVPSTEDFVGMKKIVSTTSPSSTKTLMMIVGTPSGKRVIGNFIFKPSDFTVPEGGIPARECLLQAAVVKGNIRNIGLALSGGGFRAIAFHLGCLRALKDRGILNQVKVISMVSGGAIIGGMYAYSSDSFPSFEQRVLNLLRNGLMKDVLLRLLDPIQILDSALTFVGSGIPAIGSDLMRTGLSAAGRLGKIRSKNFRNAIQKLQPPLRRWNSRTDAFEYVLDKKVFHGLKLTDGRRKDIDLIINACELSTGSAFRFGSNESGCWRYGKLIDNKIPVASAVAASAAYPPFFPTFDKLMTFENPKGEKIEQRVFLTDGGVFDNLGVTPLEPNRSEEFTNKVFNPDYIICCDAGHGLPSGNSYPYWWPSRMSRSLESIFRKVQNSGYARLHSYVKSNELKGFLLPYLGQLDHRLPYCPPDLVRREEVNWFPTDLSPMGEDEIELISKRGEQLTRILISRYTPEL